MTSATTKPELQVTSILNTASFLLFSQLPKEIRFMIWKFSFVPRRVRLYNASYRPKLSSETITLLLVNHEAAQIFKENYLKFFHTKGQMALLLNPEIDILCFDSGLKSLAKIARQYPKHMHRLRYIEVFAGLRTAGLPDPIEWSKMDLRCLSVQCIITIRGCHCYEGTQGLPTKDCKCDENKSGARIITVLGYLKRALLRYQAPGAQRYIGPRLAALFQASFSFHDWIYFETTTDLHQVRYGRINPISLKADSISAIRQPRRVEWLALDALWDRTEARLQGEEYPNDWHTDVFHHMQAARIPCLAKDRFKKQLRTMRRELWTCWTKIGDDRYGSRLDTWHVRALALAELGYCWSWMLPYEELKIKLGERMAEIVERLGVVSVCAENPRIVGPLDEYYQSRREAGQEPRRDYCAVKCLVDGHLLGHEGIHDHCFQEDACERRDIPVDVGDFLTDQILASCPMILSAE